MCVTKLILLHTHSYSPHPPPLFSLSLCNTFPLSQAQLENRKKKKSAVVSQWTESNPSNPNGCEIGLEMSLRAERGKVKIKAAVSSVFDGV